MRILFRLVHPNILRVRDIFEKRSQMCTIFEHTNGTLLDVINQWHGEDECMKYFVQICLALFEVHHADMSHGSITLTNLRYRDVQRH